MHRRTARRWRAAAQACVLVTLVAVAIAGARAAESPDVDDRSAAPAAPAAEEPGLAREPHASRTHERDQATQEPAEDPAEAPAEDAPDAAPAPGSSPAAGRAAPSTPAESPAETPAAAPEDESQATDPPPSAAEPSDAPAAEPSPSPTQEARTARSVPPPPAEPSPSPTREARTGRSLPPPPAVAPRPATTPQPSSTPLPTASPSARPSEPTPTPSPTPTGEAAPTPTPTPTRTAAPTPTATPTPTPSPTRSATPTPTPTPTPSPTQQPVPAPSGDTPAGIGVPDGVRLTSHPAGEIDLGGRTLENVVIEGDATVTSPGVLRNVRVTGKLVLRADDVELHSSEVGSLSLSGTDGALVSGVEVFGHPGSDGIHITSGTGQVRDVHLRDVWIHSPRVKGNSHYDGIQVRGVQGLTLERVRIELGPWQKQYNAALFLEDANGGNSGVRILDSWLGGGGYTLYSFAKDVRIERTVFAGGKWGHLYPRSQTSEIRVFSGNTDAQGRPLTLGSTSID